jgi:hypothetical protein
VTWRGPTGEECAYGGLTDRRTRYEQKRRFNMRARSAQGWSSLLLLCKPMAFVLPVPRHSCFLSSKGRVFSTQLIFPTIELKRCGKESKFKRLVDTTTTRM